MINDGCDFVVVRKQGLQGDRGCLELRFRNRADDHGPCLNRQLRGRRWTSKLSCSPRNLSERCAEQFYECSKNQDILSSGKCHGFSGLDYLCAKP